jgi:hypothetical protein
MAGPLDKIKQLAAPFGRGLLAEAAPAIAGGVLTEFLHQWHVDVASITQDIQSDRSLWTDIGPDERRQLAFFAKKIGNLDFITPEWFIENIKEDFPAVASLFLNWPEAGEWLVRQIDELKREVMAQPEQ